MSVRATRFWSAYSTHNYMREGGGRKCHITKGVGPLCGIPQRRGIATSTGSEIHDLEAWLLAPDEVCKTCVRMAKSCK